MARLEDLAPGASVKGIPPDGLVTGIDAMWHGSVTMELQGAAPAGTLIPLYHPRHNGFPKRRITAPTGRA